MIPPVPGLPDKRARPKDRGVVYFNQRMGEPVSVELPSGRAVLLSTTYPEREGPNEDVAAILDGPDGSAALLVADGVGGHAAGDQAAKLAAQAIGRKVARAAPAPSGLRESILDGFEAANRAVARLNVGAATTLTVAELVGDTVRPYHAGDTAIVLIGQRGRIKLEALAHAPVAYAVEAGLMEEHEALSHADRAVVHNLVGEAGMRIDVGASVPIARRDTLLLASDGLTDNLRLSEIIDLARKGPLEVAASNLAKLALQRMAAPAPGEPSKPDDLTILLYRRTP